MSAANSHLTDSRRSLIKQPEASWRRYLGALRHKLAALSLARCSSRLLRLLLRRRRRRRRRRSHREANSARPAGQRANSGPSADLGGRAR